MKGRTPWDEAQARAVIAAKSAEPGAVLPILHALQERFGYIDDAAIAAIAEALNLSKAETLGVVSFYHDFRRAPVDGATLKLCRAESCQALGCEDLVAHLGHAHGVEVDHADDERAARRRDRLLPRQLRAFARRAARRRADRPARRPSDRRDRRASRREAVMSARVFVPADSSAVSVGADRTARAIARQAQARGVEIALVRTGSRGLYWLEPLVEVETAAGRFGYGPIAPWRGRPRCSTRASSPAARTPRRSGSSTKSPI